MPSPTRRWASSRITKLFAPGLADPPANRRIPVSSAAGRAEHLPAASSFGCSVFGASASRRFPGLASLQPRMSTVKIPPVLRSSTGGEKEIAADGANVGDVLRELASKHPDTERQLFADDGQLNRYVNVYLNDEDVRVLGGL